MPSSIDLGRREIATMTVIMMAAATTAPMIQAKVDHWTALPDWWPAEAAATRLEASGEALMPGPPPGARPSPRRYRLPILLSSKWARGT